MLFIGQASNMTGLSVRLGSMDFTENLKPVFSLLVDAWVPGEIKVVSQSRFACNCSWNCLWKHHAGVMRIVAFGAHSPRLGSTVLHWVYKMTRITVPSMWLIIIQTARDSDSEQVYRSAEVAQNLYLLEYLRTAWCYVISPNTTQMLLKRNSSNSINNDT